MGAGHALAVVGVGTCDGWLAVGAGVVEVGLKRRSRTLLVTTKTDERPSTGRLIGPTPRMSFRAKLHVLINDVQ